MKRKIKIGIAVCAVLAILLTVVILLKHSISPSPKPLTLDEAKALYTNAQTALHSAQNKVQTITSFEEINYNGSIFSEQLVRTETYNGIGTNNSVIHIDEDMTIGTHSIHNSELYIGDQVYLTIDGSNFTANCSAHDRSNRITPTILLDTELYADISGTDTGNDYTISFASPLSVETWFPIFDGKLLTAGGTVNISYDGQLTSSTYTATYTVGSATVTKTVTVAAHLVQNDIQVPDDLSIYTPISYIDGARALERISGFLMQAACISAEYTDNIYFGALGDKREQNINLHAYKDTQLSASIQTSIVLSNESDINQQTKHLKQETYINNTYAVQTDGQDAIVNPDITENAMQQYLQNLLLSTVMLPKFIASAEIVEAESTLQIHYTGTEEFAAFLRQNAGSLLYQDPELLNAANSSINTAELICHITLGKQTGLPISSGINYSASFTAEGLPYQFHYYAEQNYTLASSESITNINKAAGN